MILTDKLKIAGAIGITALISGCGTIGPDGKTDGERIMDGFTEAFIGGGGLFRANEQIAASEGDYKKAAAWGALGNTAEANYNRQTQIEAAREGRTEVNVNVGGQQQAETQSNLSFRNSSSKLGPVTSVKLFYWIDKNKDGAMDFEKEMILRDTSYFDEESTIVIMAPYSIYEGKKVFMKIKDEDGGLIEEDTEGKYVEPMVSNVEERERQRSLHIFNTIPVSNAKKIMLANGKFGKGGERRYLLEFYVESEKIPRESKSFIINYGEFKQPDDPNLRYEPELGEIRLLACRYIKDLNNNGVHDYPDEFKGIGNKFNLQDNCVVIFGTNKRLPYARSKIINENGETVHEDVVENSYGMTYNIKDYLELNKKINQGKYNFVFYWKDKADGKERYVGQKEIEFYESNAK